MEICNIFNPIDKENGNILMFSQYAHDLTQMTSGRIKVLPSNFIALNVNYSSLRIPAGWEEVFKEKQKTYLFPNMLQNIYENASVLCREKYSNDTTKLYTEMKHFFWNYLYITGMLQQEELSIKDKNTSKSYYISNIVYKGDINLQSFNKHNYVGYNEIYCYIPSNATRFYNTINLTTVSNENKLISNQWQKDNNNSYYIEGFDDLKEQEFQKNKLTLKVPFNYEGYTYKHNITVDGIKIPQEYINKKFKFNTIIIFYKICSGDKVIMDDIPMAVYLPSTFDGDDMQSVDKIVTSDDIYGSGTSYGLRICNRYNLLPQNKPIIETELQANDSEYAEISYVLSEMAKTQSMMNNIITQMHKDNLFLKEALAAFKNNKTNVPYIKSINGENYWFINGKNTGVKVNVISCDTNLIAAEDNQVSDEMDKYIHK